jgi:hypothetical protein
VPHSLHWLWLVSQKEELRRIAPPLDPNKGYFFFVTDSLWIFDLKVCQRAHIHQLNDDFTSAFSAYLGLTGHVPLSWAFRILLLAQVKVNIADFQLLWHAKELASLAPAAVGILEGREAGFVWHHLPTVEVLNSCWCMWWPKYACSTARNDQFPWSIPWRGIQKWIS